MSRKIAMTVLSAALACASGRGAERGEPVERGPQQAAAPEPADGSAATAGTCPTEVPGTQLSAADTPDGEALTFTTTGDVEELRRRVHAMADMHDQQEQALEEEMGTGSVMGYGTGEGTAERGAPTSSASVQDVDGGARISYHMSREGDLEQLRSQVRADASEMQRPGCGSVMGPGAQPR